MIFHLFIVKKPQNRKHGRKKEILFETRFGAQLSESNILYILFWICPLGTSGILPVPHSAEAMMPRRYKARK